MSFANQALCAEYIVDSAKALTPGVHRVPVGIDEEVGRLKLQSLGIDIDALKEEQQEYLESWESGT
jgi:adenosylhomocysteinase